MISVRDFCEMCCDDACTVAIWDGSIEKEVFRGEMRDAMFSDYDNYDVESFDPPYFDENAGVVVLCLNIWTE